MVQKYQSPVRVYKHPFELVMAVSVFTCTCSQPSVHMNIASHNVQSYVMLVGGRFRGHPQKVVIELHTLHVIGSQVENAVAEGKLLCIQFISCSPTFPVSFPQLVHVTCLLAAQSVLCW